MKSGKSINAMMKKTSICFFSPHDLPNAHISRNFDFAKRLSRKGHTVKIIANNFSHRDKKRIIDNEGYYYQKSTCDGIEVIWLNTIRYNSSKIMRGINALSYFFLSLRYALTNKDYIEFYIGDSVPTTAGLAAYIATKAKRRKFIYQVRDVWPIALVYDKAINKTGLTYSILRLIEVFLYKKAYKICSTVPMLNTHLQECGVSESKLDYIPNGVDLSLFKYKPASEDGKTFNIIYAGGFGNAHDVETIIRAAALLASKGFNLRFKFYGEGLKLKSCKQLASKLSLYNVEFIRPIEKIKLAEELSTADVLVGAVTDSDAYEFGTNLNKLYDYMAVGRPIVMAIRSPHRIIEDAECGYICNPEDPVKFSEAICLLYLMTNTQRNRMGMMGRDFVRKHFDINQLSDSFEMMLIN